MYAKELEGLKEILVEDAGDTTSVPHAHVVTDVGIRKFQAIATIGGDGAETRTFRIFHTIHARNHAARGIQHGQRELQRDLQVIQPVRSLSRNQDCSPKLLQL
jgi:hypothetical protein